MTKETPGTFLDHLLEGIKHAGIAEHRSIVCAISGGIDSTALLLGLHDIRGDSRFLAAAHYNHRARGDESDEDEAFVRELCAQREIPLFVGKADSADATLDENTARRERYKFLTQVAEKVDADTIAVAHTAEDQAETVLLRITRGTGSRGASGMKPRRPISAPTRRGLTITRPMLRISRKQAEIFLDSIGIVARHDSSNDDWQRYARNRIRHRVVPELKALNPQAIAAINRFAEIQSSQADLVDQLAGQAIRSASTGVDNVLLREPVAASHKTVAAAVLSRMFRYVADAETQLDQQHIDKLLNLITTGKSAEYALPDGITFWTNHANFGIGRERKPHDETAPYPPPIARPIRLGFGDKIELGNGYFITSEIAPVPVRYPSDDKHEAWLNPAAFADHHFLVRNRKKADIFQPLGMESDVNLANFLINAKVPASWRDRIPIIATASDNRIAWLPGIRIAEWARVPNEATRALRLKLVRA